MIGRLHWIKSLWNNRTTDTRPGPKPEFKAAVIGDIHGRADLLGALLTKISLNSPEAKLIFVGDYVDRGPDSRAVIAALRALPDAICIRGNHETMLLEFLDEPIERGGRWLRNGGSETLSSYGIALSERSSRVDVLAAQQKLHEILSDGAENWLRNLPLYWCSGNLLVTHAGPDPACPVVDQDENNFLWGHNRFLRDPRSDDLWVAHGHWSRDRPSCKDGRINVDTGAWASGRLTAALISPDGDVSFTQTR